MDRPSVEVRLPDWTGDYVRSTPAGRTDAERMHFAAGLARENVLRGTGGPFAAAVYESDSGRLVAVGVNMVTTLGQSMLHGEVVAIMLAQRQAGSFTLSAPELPRHELVTSCEPCAMCWGAILWSGVRRLVCGAKREDAESLGFDEGPVTEASYDYLTRRGIEVVRGVERAAAREVLELYASREGVIYNG